MQGTQSFAQIRSGRRGRPFAIALLAFLFVSCTGPEAGDSATVTSAAETPGAAITGTLTYRERIALSPAAVAIVELQDVSRTDVRATTLSSLRLEAPGDPPIPFRLDYDPAQIDERMRYAVRAEIREGERLLFTTDRHHGVLTGDSAGGELEILLIRAQERPPEPPEQPLAGTRWVLDSIVGDSGSEPAAEPSGEEPLPSLDFTADRVSGYSGCNNFNGGYEATDGTLAIGLLAITQRACPAMALERTVVQALGEADAYLLDAPAQTLTLISQGKPSLIYRRAADEV